MTSGLSFDKALYPHEYKKLTHKVQISKQNEQKARNGKIHAVRPAGLETRSSFSYTIITKHPIFNCAVALCTMQNELLVISDLSSQFKENHGLERAVKGLLPRSQVFGWRLLSRDPDIQFTRELFLHVAEVHILLVVHGEILFRLS
jgi:hypothetical protein